MADVNMIADNIAAKSVAFVGWAGTNELPAAVISARLTSPHTQRVFELTRGGVTRYIDYVHIGDELYCLQMGGDLCTDSMDGGLMIQNMAAAMKVAREAGLPAPRLIMLTGIDDAEDI
jgi:hypothetical protein